MAANKLLSAIPPALVKKLEGIAAEFGFVRMPSYPPPYNTCARVILP